MKKDNRLLRATFNTSADVYDKIRPGYPQTLIEDVIILSSIPSNGRILEIGSGTGKATERFASRGYSMVCLDIGKDLAAVAAHKFKESHNIEIVVSSFEEWNPEGRIFDLVIAATSFHWIDPAIAFAKSAEVLRSNGSLAIFTHTPIQQDKGFFVRVNDVYREFAPSMIDVTPVIKVNFEERAAMKLFMEPIERCYQWATEYSTKEYIDLLCTYSDHISLIDVERKNLFSGIADLIDREYDGKVLKYYKTVLRLLKRKN